MLKPIEKTLNLPDGGSKTYILSKFPAIAGREIVTQYPVTASPKIGDYKTNEELMLKVMSYVGVKFDDGTIVPLSSRDLVNNHVEDFETLIKLEWAMMEYNCSFFRNGAASRVLSGLKEKFQMSIFKTLTTLSEQLSAKK